MTDEMQGGVEASFSASRLYVPRASARPGERPDFSGIGIPAAGETPRPPVEVHPAETLPITRGLVRVLDDEHRAVGPWDPGLTTDTLLRGLRHMLHVRAYDERMFRMQRQGQLSFYMKCTGEEAVAVAQAMALRPDDMLFPSYRQQGLLFVRGRPVVDMMCHCISNAGDNLKGRQMPVFYSWKAGNFFSISGNLATQVSQAVGWAMASAYKGEDALAAAWVGEGSTAEADVHNAMLFAGTYRAPVLLNVVNNQWAISTPASFASAGIPFAARGLGYNLASLRVDGNDFLAVYAATRWAAERARAGYGATFLELVTYRVAGHSTSDNPDAYRARDEASVWPLGDPVERLRAHLSGLGAWDDASHEALQRELEASITLDWQAALAKGTLEDGPHWPVESIFEDVFAEMSPYLERQRDQLRGNDP